MLTVVNTPEYCAGLAAAAEYARMEAGILADLGRDAESKRAWRLYEYLAAKAELAVRQ